MTTTVSKIIILRYKFCQWSVSRLCRCAVWSGPSLSILSDPNIHIYMLEAWIFLSAEISIASKCVKYTMASSLLSLVVVTPSALRRSSSGYSTTVWFPMSSIRFINRKWRNSNSFSICSCIVWLHEIADWSRLSQFSQCGARAAWLYNEGSHCLCYYWW